MFRPVTVPVLTPPRMPVTAVLAPKLVLHVALLEAASQRTSYLTVLPEAEQEGGEKMGEGVWGEQPS